MNSLINSLNLQPTKNRFLSCCLILLLGLTFAGCGSTKIKYIQHKASTKLKLADNTILTAPSGKHYMLYLVNCIDNSKRNEGFYFTADRLLENGQYRVNDVSLISKLVGTGDVETNIGQVVFEVSGAPEPYFYNLNYASFGSEKVFMMNQTTSGSVYGPAYFIVDMIDLNDSSNNSSPFLGDNLCANKGSYH